MSMVSVCGVARYVELPGTFKRINQHQSLAATARPTRKAITHWTLSGTAPGLAATEVIFSRSLLKTQVIKCLFLAIIAVRVFTSWGPKYWDTQFPDTRTINSPVAAAVHPTPDERFR